MVKKTRMQRLRTVLRNIALIVESFHNSPRWLSLIRLMLAVPISCAMIWIGFFSGVQENATAPMAQGFIIFVGIIGVLVLSGVIIMLLCGYQTAYCWRKVERIRGNTSN